MSLGFELSELSQHLRQERLYVSSEREQLQTLYEQVKTSAEQLYQQSWVARQQKDLLDSLIFSSKEVSPAECCQRTNLLESSTFVDSYKQLSYHDSKYGEFFKFLQENPIFLGQLLHAAEKNNTYATPEILKVLMHSVYSNCILQEDESCMLTLLKCLIELQVANCDNPRRMLRRGSCAFSIAFKHLFDVVFSAKLFLTAALHDPIMRLLMEDEWFYDIDPSKAPVRFPPAERLRRFGEPDTDDYREKLAKYRTSIVDKLVMLANRFIASIKSNMHCFPPGLGWVVALVYQTLTKTGKMDHTEVRAVCADLVFALFICPAICDPEPHGITTDIPISNIARHNLMQMAQIVQILALSNQEERDPKVQDLYSRFDKDCLSSLLDSLLEGMCVEVPSVTPSQLPCLTRTCGLIQLTQLNSLISYLRSAVQRVDECPEKKSLDEMLKGLNPVTPSTPGTPGGAPGQAPLSGILTSSQTPPGTPSAQKKIKGKKKVSQSVVSIMSSASDESASISSVSLEAESQPVEQEDVLVIALGNDNECPGMLSEQKVLSCDQENKRRRVKYQTVPGGYDVGSAEIQEKRTRFSLSHDQESIGNTSDIPEAISEGASSHSVGSQDLENDDDNDNFSDMISANVSGRGTPNISGRDTPLSQAESVEQERATHPQPALPDTVQKKNREDVTDKFGKFEIKQELDYDLKSTVSDTWSTDVLASDSEPPEMNQQVRLEEIAEEMVRQHLLTTQERVSEMSETASDAWSTDVLASDTEEKQQETLSEFDDMSSMADTGSNLDDIHSESDMAEVTPLASGFQSPSDADNGDVFHNNAMVAPSSGNHGMGHVSRRKSDNDTSSPTFSDTVFTDMDDRPHTSDSLTNDRSVISGAIGHDSNRLFVPIKKKPSPSLPGYGNERLRGSAESAAFLSHKRMVDNYVMNQRPMSSPDSTVPMRELHNLSIVTPDTGARPKTNQRRDGRPRKKSDSSQQSAVSRQDIHESNDTIYRQEVKRVLSTDSGVSSAQFLDSRDMGMSDNIGMQSKQQVDVDLSLFDPLASASKPVVTCSNLQDGAGSSTSHAFQSYSKQTASNQLISLEDEPDGTSAGKFGSRLSGRSNPAAQGNCDMYVLQKNQLQGSNESIPSSESSLSKDGDGATGGLKHGHPSNNSIADDKDISFNEDSNTPSGKRRGLFKTFKEKIHKVVDVTSQTAAGIKKKGSKHEKDNFPSDENSLLDLKDEGTAEPNIVVTETSDDILAKYRKKSILTSTPTTSESLPTEKERRLTLKDSDITSPLDPSNLENCLSFLDAKRKLRLVLSSSDFQVGAGLFGQSAGSYVPRDLETNNNENNELVNVLRTQLSEAINLQNKDTIAQLHEALRCVRQFEAEGCRKLIRSLQEDYRSRASYVSYLVRCKQGLLTTLSHINQLHKRIRREKEIYNKHMTNVCVRIFLEGKEKNTIAFIADFTKLTVSDEKTDLVERYLQFLYQQMNKDPIWHAATEDQLEDAKLAMERFIMSRIYTQAMYPNGDGDYHRDQLLSQHMKNLGRIISVDHKDLKIPKMYHLECPWPAAQREIYMINAYRTPKDKLRCVQRCATTIMNLLSMANEKSVPAADDFMPVFIFVIIKANPPCILSTIQYVNSFYENRLQGEEQYWWMQFCAAVEFSKTMDYPRDSD